MDKDYDVIIAGAGPCGTSAAIHLAQHGVRVLLVEQKELSAASCVVSSSHPNASSTLKNWVLLVRCGCLVLPTSLKQFFYSATRQTNHCPESMVYGSAALGLSRAAMDDNCCGGRRLSVLTCWRTPLSLM
jgi:hypothetical protein